PGYVLELEPDAVDARRFERLLGEPGSEPAERAERLREALGLWRGATPLAGLGDEPFVAEEARRFEELRLTALEDRVDADLELGRHAAVISELEAIVGGNPHRERPVGQIMLALYRCDRQTDALQAFRDLRGRLDELGLEPAPDLQELQLGILRQDDSLRAPEVAAPPPGPGEEPRSRRVVTVVAIDIAGADALDPETLDALLGRAL